LIVYDSTTGTARRLLDRHPSVMPQNLLIRTPIRDMSDFGGLLEMKTGVDGIALSRDGAWLSFAAMNHDTRYRMPTPLLTDPGASPEAIAAAVEAVGPKPLSDGLSIADDGTVFITDVEHGAVMALAPDGTLSTVVRDPRIRWADGLSFGLDGWLYLADSAIPHLVPQSAEHHAAQVPHAIWRFRPGPRGAPGQ
jgi:sugar lactone lactonase YvrE